MIEKVNRGNRASKKRRAVKWNQETNQRKRPKEGGSSWSLAWQWWNCKKIAAEASPQLPQLLI
jgi:hypothetical protein